MQVLISMLAFALLTAGFLWPTEEAVSGDGLYLVVLWMLLGFIHALHRWRSIADGSVLRGPIRWIDLGVCLIAAGHMISTAVVFQIEGDRRSAMNLTFEWIGLYIAWWIFRSLFLDRRIAAQGVAVVTAICIGLSCFGIWQHHAFYAEQSEWYRQLRSELDQAMVSGDPSQSFRRFEITRLFQERLIPLEGAERIGWENRLLNSSEPFATFALANTLAGILAVGLVLLTGQATSKIGERQRMSWIAMLLLTIQICVMAYCLILTKSRSAWLGAIVGIGVLVVARTRVATVQHVVRWLMAGSLIAAVLVGSAVVAGGLDKEVILESTRSLQFRLLYWTGTLKMLREQPLAGAGPGNFRQVYLQHKAEESSEEIRDPHNLFLDAWSSSGLTGLAGLLLMTGWMLWRLMKKRSEHGIPAAAQSRSIQRLWKVPGALIGGFLLQAAWTWLNGSDEWIDEPAKLLLLAGIPLLVMRGNASLRQIDGTTFLAAALAMIVNLLAAGGFEMPAVMSVLMLCLAAAASQVFYSHDGILLQNPTALRTLNLMQAGLCMAGFVAVLTCGLVPVTVSRHHEEAGTAILRDLQYPARALDRFQQSIVADPKSVTPRQRIAEVASYQLSKQVASRAAENAGKTELKEMDAEERRLIDEALDACENLICADRRGSFAYQLRAEVRRNAGLITDDLELQELALQDLQTVTRQYPSSVEAWLRLAEGLDAAGAARRESARFAAGRVLHLDHINHEWGHADRFLTDEQLARMHEIIGAEPQV